MEGVRVVVVVAVMVAVGQWQAVTSFARRSFGFSL